MLNRKTLVLVGLLFSPEKQDSRAVVGSLSNLKFFQIGIPYIPGLVTSEPRTLQGSGFGIWSPADFLQVARCPLAFISNLARVMLPTST